MASRPNGMFTRKVRVVSPFFGDPVFNVAAVPYASGDMWATLGNAKHVRSFSVKVQPENNLSLLDDGEVTFMELARNSVAAYHAKTVDVTVTGDPKSSRQLDKGNVIGTMRQVLGYSGTSKVRAVVSSEEGSQVLDFLKISQVVKGSIDRFPKDVESDWKSRKNFLLSRFDGIKKHGNDPTHKQ